MTTAYQVSYEYGEYSHSDVAIQTTNLEDATKEYHSTVSWGATEDSFCDYVCLETIDVELDDEGNVDDVIDYGEVILEHVFNEYTE